MELQEMNLIFDSNDERAWLTCEDRFTLDAYGPEELDPERNPAYLEMEKKPDAPQAEEEGGRRKIEWINVYTNEEVDNVEMSQLLNDLGGERGLPENPDYRITTAQEDWERGYRNFPEKGDESHDCWTIEGKNLRKVICSIN